MEWKNLCIFTVGPKKNYFWNFSWLSALLPPLLPASGEIRSRQQRNISRQWREILKVFFGTHCIGYVWFWGKVILFGMTLAMLLCIVLLKSSIYMWLWTRRTRSFFCGVDLKDIMIKTLPKAQRTRGLSSYHRISIKHQLQNLNQTSASPLNLNFKSWPNLASEYWSRFNFVNLNKHQ